MVISGLCARLAFLKAVAASVLIMVTGAANAECLPVALQEQVIDMGEVVFTPDINPGILKVVKIEYPSVVLGDDAGCRLTPVLWSTSHLPVLRRFAVYLTSSEAGFISSSWDRIIVITSNGNSRFLSANSIGTEPIREITGGHAYGVVTTTSAGNSLPFSGAYRQPIYEVSNEAGQVVWRVVISGTGIYIPVYLTTDNVNVTLPPILSTDLQGPGSVAGRTVIPLSIISENVVSQNFISFDANTVTSGNIIIPDHGADTGVGFQIVNTSSGTPVQLGQPQLVPGNINGVFENFSVQYIQVADSVNGGQVSAVVTMTLTYQ